MIKMWKRLTCMLLSVLMIMSLLPMGVGAAQVKSDNIITSSAMYSYYADYTMGEDGTSFSSNGSQIGVNLGQTVQYGESITLEISGTTGGPFRMYLLNGGSRASSVYYAADQTGFTTDGDFTFTVTMTVDGGDSSSTSANGIIFKGVNSDLPTMTITSIKIVTEIEEDNCTNMLVESGLSSNNKDGSITDGVFVADSGANWIAIKLDKAYNVGETVKLHVIGTSGNDTVRFYLSQGDTGNRITADQTLTVTNGVFDGYVEFTVMDSSTDSQYTGTQAIYLNIKPKSSVSTFTSLTIAHLGVVPKDYSVTVNECTGGTVTANKSEADAGKTVTLTVTPKDSYRLSSLSVIDASGNAVAVTDNTFVMPSSNVTVTATFEDTCETTIAMKSDSIRNSYSGTVTVDEGVSVNYTGLQIEFKLPATVSNGDTVTVHIVGTCDSTFRVWLADGYNTYSNQVSVSSDEFDTTLTLTATNDAEYILFKAPSSDGTLDNLTVTHVGITYPEATVPEFYGRTLTLDGKIGVTYYFDMTGVTNPSSYVLKATIGTDGAEQTIAAGETKTIGGVEYYRYTVYVGVADINTEITAVLTDDTNSVDVSGYSVANYCSAVESGGLPESELCTALLTYGNYAGIFNNKTGVGLDSYTLSDVSIDIKDTEFGTDVTHTDGYEKTLVLDDEISIRLYMTTEQTVYVNGVAYAPESNTDSNSETYAYRVDIPVPAKDMDKMYEICDESGEVLTKYSVYSYILNKQNDSETDLANLVKAIYNYSLAAESYDGWI